MSTRSGGKAKRKRNKVKGWCRALAFYAVVFWFLRALAVIFAYAAFSYGVGFRFFTCVA